jgi:proteasome component ECM29
MTTNTPENENKKAVADANSQLQSLSRVSHKLAMVDNAQKLQTVLDKLLPRLLQRIGDNNQDQKNAKESELRSVLSKIHMKLIEMLSHVMKRVRDDKNCRLTNARGILDLLLTTTDDNSCKRTLKDCDSFSLNLSLTFLTLAIPRCTLSELDGLLPGLLILHACYERRIRSQTSVESSSSASVALESMRKQWHQVSHLLLRTLERIVVEEESSLNGASRKVVMSSTKRTNDNNKRIKTDINSNGQGTNEAKDHVNEETSVTGLDEARSLLSQQEPEKDREQISIADATYELLLDALLYQTQVGNVPPAGMSSAGWDRLKSGHSVMERDWAAEMAPLNRLSTFKNRLLEWIAPHRRFCLFLGNTSGDGDKDSNGKDNDESKTNCSLSSLMIGRSRTVALLVIASGDPMKGVSEPAKQYLKQYYDSQRETGGFGNASNLIKELIALCVGGINTQSILSASASSNTDATESCSRHGTLGILQGGLFFGRRQVSDSHFSELMLTANKALDDVTYDDDDDLDAIGKLSVLASDKMLSKLGNAVGLTLLRGKPYIAAAELLNGFVVRLEKQRRRYPETHSMSINKYALEARALTLALTILAPIAASRASSSSSAQISEASVAVRDSIYGTISILCRSRFAQEQFLCLLAAGDTETTVLSTDLFQLLFRCIGNEIDKLRPRATAALDALLFACRRIVEGRDEVRKVQQNQNISSGDINPWGENASSISSAAATGRNASQSDGTMSPIDIANQLGKSLLPILWAASHKTQPRQSRVAASRWSSDLLVDLDVINATHILSYLAGDTDVTAAAIAKEGLGIQGSKNIVIADFDELIHVLISEDEQMETATSLPTFWDFSSSGKAVSVKCLLRSFLDDFNGGDRGLRALMGVLTKCLASTDTGTNEDLIDACSEAFSVCMEASSVARVMIQSSSLYLGLKDLRDLIMTTGSAKAKRFLADAFGNFLMDTPLLGSQWTEVVTEALAFASKALSVEPLKPSNDVQGAALLGGTCVRLIRLHPALIRHDTYDMASELLKRLGSALTNADDMIGNIFCDAVLLSCSDGLKMELHDRYVYFPTLLYYDKRKLIAFSCLV